VEAEHREKGAAVVAMSLSCMHDTGTQNKALREIWHSLGMARLYRMFDLDGAKKKVNEFSTLPQEMLYDALLQAGVLGKNVALADKDK